MKVKVMKIGNRIIGRRVTSFDKLKLFLYGLFLGFLGAMLLYSILR